MNDSPNYLNTILRDYYKLKFFSHSQLDKLTIKEKFDRVSDNLEIVKKKIIYLKCGIEILGKLVEDVTRNCFRLFHSYETDVNYMTLILEGKEKMTDIIGQAYK